MFKIILNIISNRSILPIDGIQIDTIMMAQSTSGGNANEEVIPHNTRT